jgi:hypothetical protein
VCAKSSDFYVSLDTQAFESASFNFKAVPFKALEDLASKGHVRLVMTDITVREVRARIEKTVVAQLGPVEKLKKQARVLRSSDLPEVHAALDLDAARVVADLHRQFDEFLSRTDTTVIDTSQLPAGPVFEKYFAGTAPFGTGNKKAEFPDAFIVDGLRRWSEENGELVQVVSGDDGLRDACEPHATLKTWPVLGHLLNHVNDLLFNRAVVDFIREQTKLRLDEIKEQITSQFEDTLYNVSDEWGDSTMTVTSLELLSDPDVIDVEPTRASLEVRFNGSFTAHLSFKDSSTGMWDGETKEMFGMEWKREEREETEEFVAEVKVKYEPFDSDGFEIEEVTLIQPNDSYTVSTSAWAGFPWK